MKKTNPEKDTLDLEQKWCEHRLTRRILSIRLILIVLQAVSNNLIPDHNAGVFTYPGKAKISTADTIVTYLLGGFVRWDAQYFMHISIYGYTYENTLAFFPLLPFTVKFITTLCFPLLNIVNVHSLTLIVFVILNTLLFLMAAKALYYLTALIYDEKFAHKSVLLFCINPASVFFSAPYTEALFAFLTFNAIYNCARIKLYKNSLCYKPFFKAVVFIALSILTRSNGLLNIGFLLYFFIHALVNHVFYRGISKFMLLNIFILFVGLLICLAPFILLQIYHYMTYCNLYFKLDVPKHVISYGKAHRFILPGEVWKHGENWCDYFIIPLPYSHVQNKYWDVGFLRYYKTKQIPNFILAFPIIAITLYKAIAFLLKHKVYLIHLGVFKNVLSVFQLQKKEKKCYYETDAIFACVLHGLFLTLFCIFFVHIQVSTRMLCSATPIVYWFATSINRRWVRFYFWGYFVVGTIMFSNFLPWT